MPLPVGVGCKLAAELGSPCEYPWWTPFAWITGFFIVAACCLVAWLVWSTKSPAQLPTRTVFPLEPSDVRDERD